MSKEVEKRKDDGEHLLYAQDPEKRPLSVELNYRTEHRRVTGDPAVGDNMLAGIVAFGRTSPEQKTQMDCYQNRS